MQKYKKQGHDEFDKKDGSKTSAKEQDAEDDDDEGDKANGRADESGEDEVSVLT